MKIYLIIILFVFTSCDFHDDRLIINNQSNENIYVAFSTDTILSLRENETFMIPDHFVSSKSQQNISKMGSQKAWEHYIKNSTNEQLHLFVLSEATLKKLSSQHIEEYGLYKSRIDISLDELIKSEWIVSYDND